MTLDVRSLAYAPCVEFPARSGFTLGWVYVHVGGGPACLISLVYLALVLLEFVVCSTAPVDLTVRTLYHCVGNAICYFVYVYLLKKLWYIIVKFFTGIMAAYRPPNMVCIYRTDGPRMYPVVFWHYTVVAMYCFSAVCSCFLLCTAIVHCKTFVTLVIDFLVHFVAPIR